MTHLLTWSASREVEGPAAADLSKCVHCGLCLQHCPTYLMTGLETESPRGRLHLIEALNQDRIEATPTYASHLNLCLVCRACESACPSGVPFGRIMERARAQLAARRPPARPGRLLRWLVFSQLLPHPRRLRLLARLLRVYQRTGLQRLVRARATGCLLPERLRQAERQLPTLPDRFFQPAAEVFPAYGQRRRRVAFFAGCVMPYLYPEVHAATLRVLRRNGCEVVVPRGQVCCGAINVHSGERTAARGLARRNLTSFLNLEVDAIVVNAAGCGSTLKEYAELIEPGAPEHAQAERFSRLVQDVNEFLARPPLRPPTRPVARRVTLQESCHLVHAQRIKAEPRTLLAQIPGLTLVDMSHPDLCCGSAGIYNLTQPAMSAQILEQKVAEIAATGAAEIVTANPGCLLQLQQGVRQAGLACQVRHVVELLDEAYGGPGAF